MSLGLLTLRNRSIANCHRRPVNVLVYSKVMCRVRAAALILLISLCALSGACGDPPEKEMQEAQTAIDSARATGGDQYAHDEFTAAVDALKRAHEAADDRDY